MKKAVLECDLSQGKQVNRPASLHGRHAPELVSQLMKSAPTELKLPPENCSL
jgi:hypothetical protein